jgi:predicted O-methyltransferase YrrM
MDIKNVIKDMVIYPISLCLNKRVVAMLCYERYFKVWEKKGIHITPVHYYQPIPDTRTLNDDLWIKRSNLTGIDINRQGQMMILEEFTSKYKNEYESLPRDKTSIPYQFYVNNGTFESVDCEILYCMIRHFKPKMIVEIGSGNSTCLSAQTALVNKEATGIDTSLIAYEPFPNKVLKAGFPGLSSLIEKRIEKLDSSVFRELQENDILFIDSSHTLKIGNDVQKLYLEILPSLREGVIIHIHDIFFPAEYPKRVGLNCYRFWTEQYLLQAFLAFNNAFEVLWAGSYMHLNYPEKLEDAFSSYNHKERWPGSFWVRKIK